MYALLHSFFNFVRAFFFAHYTVFTNNFVIWPQIKLFCYVTSFGTNNNNNNNKNNNNNNILLSLFYVVVV